MDDIPTETIERYLKELGFDDVSPELMDQLKAEIAQRMRSETDPAPAKAPARKSAAPKRTQRAPRKHNKYFSSDESDEASAPAAESEPEAADFADSKKYRSEPSESSDIPEPPAARLRKPKYVSVEDDAIENTRVKSKYERATNPVMAPRPMESACRTTRAVQLLGPNRLTLAQKQKIGADPVTNLLKYERAWAVQGDPSQRAQRLWKNKVRGIQMENQARRYNSGYE